MNSFSESSILMEGHMLILVADWKLKKRTSTKRYIDVSKLLSGGVHSDCVVKNSLRPILDIIVPERPHSRGGLSDLARYRTQVPRVDIVIATNRQSNPVAFGNDNACWPNLHIRSIDFIRIQEIGVCIRVGWQYRCTARLIQAPTRHPEPTMCHRRVRVIRTRKGDLSHIGCKHPQDEK